MWITYMRMYFSTLSQFLWSVYVVVLYDPIQTILVTVSNMWSFSPLGCPKYVSFFRLQLGSLRSNLQEAHLKLILDDPWWTGCFFRSKNYDVLTGLNIFTLGSYFLWVQRFPRLTLKENYVLMSSFFFLLNTHTLHFGTFSVMKAELIFV